MKSCSILLLILLTLVYVALFPAVLQAARLKVLPEVTGHLGRDVLLPCELIEGTQDNITQVQWDFQRAKEKNETIIIVFSTQFGLNIPESPLKVRLNMEKQSLMIRDVQMKDSGLYTCSISTFPSGSFQEKTKLIVQEQRPLSPEVISTVVIAVVLLVGILASLAYFIFIRRGSSIRPVDIDSDLVMDVARPSVVARNEDVVYSDVKLKTSRDAKPPLSCKGTKTVNDDVTYAEVVVLHRQPQ